MVQNLSCSFWGGVWGGRAGGGLVKYMPAEKNEATNFDAFTPTLPFTLSDS